MHTYIHTVPLKGNVALARDSMLEARKLDTLYCCEAAHDACASRVINHSRSVTFYSFEY